MRHIIRRAALVLMLVTAMSVFAQESTVPVTSPDVFVPTHSLGDQSLAINLGGFFPLFFSLGSSAFAPTNLTVGGVGSLAWSSYLNSAIKVGIEVGGSFAFTPNLRTLFLVPITATGSYVFDAYPFEFPVTLGLGVSIARLDDLLKFDPIAKLGGSFYWNYNTQWAFGANLMYWFIPQIYTDFSDAGTTATRLGNFAELTLSALYHF